jgi:alkylated DNA nucleotide flippase Atl1
VARQAPEAGSSEPTVTYRSDLGLIVRSAVIDDVEVTAEALRWTKGTRGEQVDPAAADGSDLSAFHRAAVGLGARVLHATADSATAVTLAGTVTQLAEKAEAAGTNLIDGAMRATTRVVEVTTKATKEATEATAQIIESARERFHQDLTTGLSETMESVQRDLDRLLAGSDGAVVGAIKEVIGRAMGDAQVSWHRSLTTTLSEVGKTLDVNNPASPLGALERRMVEQQQRQHAELTSKLDHVQELVGGAAAAAATAAAVAAVQATSPAKGRSYQDSVGGLLEAIATGMACSYMDISDTVGLVKACKKGDGILEGRGVDSGGPAPRVVVELTTQGHPRNWPQYLEFAERNRGAQASLGIVPTRDLVPGGELVSVIGANRMVLAFNPDEDAPSLLRATLQLLLVQAQRRLSEDRAGDLGLVDTKLEEARRRLVEIGEIIKAAVAVRNGAGKVVTGLESLQGSLVLTIDQARAALANCSLRDAAPSAA